MLVLLIVLSLACVLLATLMADAGEPGGTVIFSLSAATFAVFVGLEAAELHAKNYAVESGHAEFYLDAEHERQWRWLPPCNGSDFCGEAVPAEDGQ